MTEGVYESPSAIGPVSTKQVETVRPDLRLSKEAGDQAIQKSLRADQVRKEAADIPLPVKLGAGIAGAQTFGLTPAIAAKLYGMDPEVYDAAESSGGYMAGEGIGFLMSALAGGGGGAARGTVGTVGRGLLGGAVGAEAAAERLFMAKVAPQLSSRLGQPLTKVLGRAAGAGVGFGMHSAGTELGRQIVHNEPLSGQVIAAEGLKGALAGAAFGGAMSAVGQGARAAGRRVGGALGKGGTPESALARVRGHSGLSSEQLARGGAIIKAGNKTAEFGGEADVYNIMRKSLGEAGEKWSSDPVVRQRVHAAAAKNYAEAVEGGIRDVGASANGQAVVDRIAARLETEIVAPASPLEAAAARAEVDSLVGETGALSGVRGTNDFNALFKAADSLGDLAGPTGKISHKAAGIIHNEIGNAFTEAASLAGKEAVGESVRSAQTAAFINRWASEGATAAIEKNAAKVGGMDPSNIMNVASTAALFGTGHWVAGGMFAARAAGRYVSQNIGGRAVEGAWNSAFGAGAAASAYRTTATIDKSVGKFFSQKSMATLPAGLTARDMRYTRKDLDKAQAHADTVIDGSAERALQEEMGESASDGLINETLAAFERARRLLQHHYPTEFSGDLTLRTVTKPKGLSAKEGKFLRIHSAISDPVKTMSKIESGVITRDEMMAIRFVYPAIHAEAVTSITNHIQLMKRAGKSLSMQKISKLGVVMDAAVDTILEKDFVSAIQSTMQPPAQPGPQAKPPEFDASSMMTPTDKGIYQ